MLQAATPMRILGVLLGRKKLPTLSQSGPPALLGFIKEQHSMKPRTQKLRIRDHLHLFLPFLKNRDFIGHRVRHTHDAPGVEDDEILFDADIGAAWRSCGEKHR